MYRGIFFIVRRRSEKRSIEIVVVVVVVVSYASCERIRKLLPGNVAMYLERAIK